MGLVKRGWGSGRDWLKEPEQVGCIKLGKSEGVGGISQASLSMWVGLVRGEWKK